MSEDPARRLEISLQNLYLENHPASAPSLREILEDWSKSIPKPHIVETFERVSRSCNDEEIFPPLIKGQFSWINGGVDYENLSGFPEEIRQQLYDLDERGKPRKVLRADADLLSLSKKGFVEFLLGAWVHPTPKAQSPERDMLEDADDVRLLTRAFAQSFEGRSVDWMERSLAKYKEMYRMTTHYGKVVPFVQSSGLGKSRLMAEWATNISKHLINASPKRFVLSVCFRDIHLQEILPKNGWPPGDKPICKFFNDPPAPQATQMKYMGEELAAAFLGALFQVVGEKVENSQTLAEFNSHWYTGEYRIMQNSSRVINFEKVEELATIMLQSLESQIRSVRPSVAKPIDAAHEDTASSDEESPFATWCQALFKFFVESHAQKLVNACKTKSFGGSDFILVLDECTQLDVPAQAHIAKGKGHPGPWHVMRLLSLRRMIKECEGLDIWTFLLDTNSGLSRLHPTTGPLAPSHRLRDSLHPLPVCPYIPFDVMVNDLRCTHNPSDALKLKYLKFYGRPYWSTLDSYMILQCAIEKLLCATALRDPSGDQVLAIFSSRLLLNLETTTDAKELAIKGVNRHMRVLLDFSDDGIISTCVPSEPILAVAASSILLESEEAYSAAMETFIRELVLKQGILEKGLQGELLARIILMISRDMAIGFGNAVIFKDPRDPEVMALTFSSFLHSFMGKDVFQYANKSFRSQQQMVYQDLLNWASEYRLNFTHFIQLDCPVHELSPKTLFECWRRGAALVCTYTQPNFDIILIIYKGSFTKFDPKGFSLVTIQVKNCVSAAKSTLIDNLTCPKLMDVNGNHWKPQYLAILMDLGTTTKFDIGGYVKLACKRAENPQAANKTNTWQGYLAAGKEPERYSIEIRNNTFDVYPSTEMVSTRSWDKLRSERMPIISNFSEIAEDMEKTLNPLLGL